MTTSLSKVRTDMGKVQLAFVQIDTSGKTKRYKYTHSDTWYKMHNKWIPHLQYFRDRSFGIIVTQEVPAKSKSGSSYEIIGVLAVCDDADELSYLNTQYWQKLKLRNGDLSKLQGTVEYADWMMSQYDEVHRTNEYYISTYTKLSNCLPTVKVQADFNKGSSSSSTLVF